MGLGLNMTGSLIFKSTSIRSWKEVLVETWEMEPSTRHPNVLDGWWGVEIFICNAWARRIRLVELFGCRTVLLLLKRYRWTNSRIARAYLHVVTKESPHGLKTFWNAHPEWQAEPGNVILSILKLLSKTGYDENHKEFNALWTGNSQTYRFILNPSEHSWTEMLKNRIDSWSAANMVDTFLGPQRSQCPGLSQRVRSGKCEPSRLETALVINDNEASKMRLCKMDALDAQQDSVHSPRYGGTDGMSSM